MCRCYRYKKIKLRKNADTIFLPNTQTFVGRAIFLAFSFVSVALAQDPLPAQKAGISNLPRFHFCICSTDARPPPHNRLLPTKSWRSPFFLAFIFVSVAPTQDPSPQRLLTTKAFSTGKVLDPLHNISYTQMCPNLVKLVMPAGRGLV